MYHYCEKEKVFWKVRNGFIKKLDTFINNLWLYTIYVISINYVISGLVLRSSSIYKFSLSVCLFVCLYPINVKTAEPIGPKFCVLSGRYLYTRIDAFKVIMQGKLFQRCTYLLYCCVLSLGGNVNTTRMSKPDMGSIFHIQKSLKYSGQMQLVCEISKLSKWFVFILLNTDASSLVYKFRPERTGFNIYAEYTQLQLTFLAL